jgi:hypothetical protein
MTPEEERRLLNIVRMLAWAWFAIGIAGALLTMFLLRTPWGLLWLTPWALLQATEIRQALRVRELN